VQHNILAKYPQGRVRVYAVWFNMLWGDSREGWDSTVLPDARVTHLWDGQKLVGRWFARQDGDPQGTYWDAYWLYDPTARWDAAPGALVGSGGPVINVGAQLQSQLVPWLTAPGSGLPPFLRPVAHTADQAKSTR
jgi:hypothetical protein